MKTSFVSILALASTFMTVLSAPTPDAAAVDVQKKSITPTIIVTDLTAAIQPELASIKSTASGLTSSSTPGQKASASSSISASVGKIVTAVNIATTAAKSLAPKRLAIRQTTSPTALAQLILTLLTDVSTALNNVIAGLGLTAALGIAAPLTTALSNLLLALEVVVDDLLTVVEELVNGLLTGLSAALAGLVL